MAFRSNISSIIPQLRKVPQSVEKAFTKKVESVVHAVAEVIYDPHTVPVWSGLALRNMIWTVGQANSVEYPEVGAGYVGEEGERRDANEAASKQTLDALDFQRPYQVYYLSNVAHHIVELEHGLLPDPSRSRVPQQGMFGLAYATVTGKLRAGGL